MISMFSGLCETSDEKANAGDEEPGFGAGDGSLEVLGEATVAAEPSEGAFDDPTLGLGLEGSDPLGPGDDLDLPSAELGGGTAELIAALDAIGEDMPLEQHWPHLTPSGSLPSQPHPKDGHPHKGPSPPAPIGATPAETVGEPHGR